MSTSGMEVISTIRRIIGQSYPYGAGSVTLNSRLYTKAEMTEVLKYFMGRRACIEINYETNQVKITDYLRQF
jgi:hypothetical protein